MRPEEITPYHRADLAARQAAARARIEAGAERARALGAAAPAAGQPDPDAELWNKGGYFAMLFCVWFVFLAPIALLLSMWD